jgi:hypothetical protein
MKVRVGFVVIQFPLSLCHCSMDYKKGDAIGGGGDESDEALA